MLSQQAVQLGWIRKPFDEAITSLQSVGVIAKILHKYLHVHIRCKTESFGGSTVCARGLSRYNFTIPEIRTSVSHTTYNLGQCRWEITLELPYL